MQVELDLGVATFRLFSMVAELGHEVAAGIYMKESQVRIVGATASGQDKVKTRVGIDLLPLGEKFDNLTALLTYERLWKKKVPINASIFGDYEVVFVRYPGNLCCILPSCDLCWYFVRHPCIMLLGLLFNDFDLYYRASILATT